MKTILALTVLTSAASLLAADPSAKEEVTIAAKKLGEKNNYSWKTIIVVPPDAQFRPGPLEGKTEKDGISYIKMTFRDTPTEAFMKGTKAAVTTPEGEWRSLSEIESNEGSGMFVGRIIRSFKTPAVQAAELAAASRDLKKENDVYAGALTEEGAKTQFRFGTISDAKGSVKFWVKDGLLSKYEVKASAKVDFNGNVMDLERTTTVEIKDVDKTKIEVPEAAQKKLS